MSESKNGENTHGGNTRGVMTHLDGSVFIIDELFALRQVPDPPRHQPVPLVPLVPLHAKEEGEQVDKD